MLTSHHWSLLKEVHKHGGLIACLTILVILWLRRERHKNERSSW